MNFSIGGVFAIFVAAVVGLCSWAIATPSEAEKAMIEKQKAEIRKAEKIPVLVSEGGGCKVYSFFDAGAIRYFANCGSSAETIKPYVQCTTSGKYRHCEDKEERIPTSQEQK